MKTVLFTTAFLLVGCVGNAQVFTDNVNGVNAKKANFAFFAQSIERDDFDGDGNTDDALTSIKILFSNDKDACANLTEEFLERENLVQAFSFTTRFTFDNEGGFVTGDTIQGEGFDFFLGNVNSFAEGQIEVFQNDQLIAKTQSAGSGILVIEEHIIDELLVGTFNDTMVLDTANTDAFDVDSNSDGQNDAQAINANFSAEFEAVFCDALL